MTVDYRLVENYIPEAQRSRQLRIATRDSRTDLVTITVPEALRLAAKRMVGAEVNKHGYLKYLIALVSIRAIMREVSNMRRPSLPSSTITHPVVHRGSAHWPVRLDRAKSGVGGTSRLHYSRSGPTVC